MFMQHADGVSGPLDQEFSRPVESIMRCEDFKSNFARRLSHRYTSRSVVTKRQNSMKLRTAGEEVEKAPKRIEQCPQLSKIRSTEQSSEVVKPPDKPMKNHNIRDTEVTALNMAIDTLKWQLTQVNWRSHVCGLKVIMSHVSERFHEGYPGTVMAQVAFEVTCDNTLNIEMKCTTTEPTILNLSNSPYFNLAGHHSGSDTMVDHMFTINADKYTAADEEGMVTGERKVVGGTAFDFRVPRVLRVMLPKIPMGGYDINFCTTRGTDQDLAFQARVLHPMTGRVLEVYSNQPGMQFYTGNLLPDPDRIVEGKRRVGYVPLVGKQGAIYKRHGLFCIMPQNYPDAINNKNFPNSVLYPGEEYVHRIQYKFGILIGRYV